MSQKLNSATVTSGTWTVDPGASRVRFNVGNMWGLAKVKGTFERVAGGLSVGPDSSYAKFSIDASSLNTKNKKRDTHLRSEDFFHVDRYPEITFEASSVVPGESGLAITGHLLIGDSRVRLDLPVEIQEDADRLIVRTSTTISREAAGLRWNRMGMIRGDATVDVELALAREA